MLSRSIALLLPISFALALSASAQGRNAPQVNGGNGVMYIGTYAGDIQVLDEASGKLVASIKLQTGIPRRLVLSRDRAKFYVLDASYEKMEVVDVATRKTDFTFTLSEGNKHVRVRSFQVDPLHRFAIVMARTATKQIDRWEIGPNTLYVYDLQQRKVSRTIDWPKGEERESADMRFSPDGKLLYFFGPDVVIMDTTEFKTVDTWELSTVLNSVV